LRIVPTLVVWYHPNPQNRGVSLKLHYYGHSAFQIESGKVAILVDPFISENPVAEGIIKVESLHPDVILVTHAHGDHWGDTPEIAASNGSLVIANFEINQYLEAKHGYTKTQSMNTGGSLTFNWGRVTQTWARHSSSFPDGTYGGNPGGFMLEIEGKCIYAMGDTSTFSEMSWLGTDFSIDYALIPIGDCFTMGPKESLRAAKMLNAKVLIPVHYNTFPAIQVDVDKWVKMMRDHDQDALVLNPGAIIDL